MLTHRRFASTYAIAAVVGAMLGVASPVMAQAIYPGQVVTGGGYQALPASNLLGNPLARSGYGVGVATTPYGGLNQVSPGLGQSVQPYGMINAFPSTNSAPSSGVATTLQNRLDQGSSATGAQDSTVVSGASSGNRSAAGSRNQAGNQATTPTAEVPQQQPAFQVGEVLQGRTSGAVDAATFNLSGVKVGLAGLIAAPASRTCVKGGLSWRCGEAGRLALERFLADASIRCVVTASVGDIAVSRCVKGRDDLGAAMVASGFAKSGDPSYRPQLMSAEAAHVGLWVSEALPRR